MRHLTRQESRQIDQLAIEKLGIPGIVLMENAGRNATDLIQRYMQDQKKKLTAALIFCGGGNNGGDGFVVARHLHNRGVHVHILATKPIAQLTGDARTNATICKNMNLPIQPAPPGVVASATHTTPHQPDLIIDALLGTGFQGTLRPDMLQLIQEINATREQPNPPTIAAIDIPSGLDCDTGQHPTTRRGEPLHAVRADLTVTFVAPKVGFAQPDAVPYLGRVEVVDIGTPPELLAQLTSP